MENKESPMERFFRLSTGKTPQSEEFKNVLKKVSQNSELVEKFEKLESDTKNLMLFDRVRMKIEHITQTNISKAEHTKIASVLLSDDINTQELNAFIQWTLSSKEGKEMLEAIRTDITTKFALELERLSRAGQKDKNDKVIKGLLEKFLTTFSREKMLLILDKKGLELHEEAFNTALTLNHFLSVPDSWLIRPAKVLIVIIIFLILLMLLR